MRARKIGWVSVLGAILALSLVGSSALAGEKQAPEDKVAVVNGSVITRAIWTGR